MCQSAHQIKSARASFLIFLKKIDSWECVGSRRLIAASRLSWSAFKVGTANMYDKNRVDSSATELFELPRCEDANVALWLAEIERTINCDEDDVRRGYRNIGGQNGLELFV